jgi:hypothetical protein
MCAIHIITLLFCYKYLLYYRRKPAVQIFHHKYSNMTDPIPGRYSLDISAFRLRMIHSLFQLVWARRWRNRKNPSCGWFGGWYGSDIRKRDATNSSVHISGKWYGSNSCADSQRFAKQQVGPYDGYCWCRLSQRKKKTTSDMQQAPQLRYKYTHFPRYSSLKWLVFYL